MKDHKVKIAIVTTLVLVLTLAVLVATGFNAAPSAAQTQPEDNGATMPRTISVVGTGTASGEPDIAQITIGVEVTNPDVQEATSEAEQRMETILAAIREQGIPDEDIQTTGFNVFADRTFEEGQPTDQVIYRVSNNVRVTVRDLNQVSTILDVAVEAGANNIHGVDFRIEDTQALEQQALQEAVNSARDKAQTLAGFANVELGELISISETIGGGGIPQPLMRAEALGVGGAGGPPIAPGELQLSTQVEAVYAIQ